MGPSASARSALNSASSASSAFCLRSCSSQRRLRTSAASSRAFSRSTGLKASLRPCGKRCSRSLRRPRSLKPLVPLRPSDSESIPECGWLESSWLDGDFNCSSCRAAGTQGQKRFPTAITVSRPGGMVLAVGSLRFVSDGPSLRNRDGCTRGLCCLPTRNVAGFSESLGSGPKPSPKAKEAQSKEDSLFWKRHL